MNVCLIPARLASSRFPSKLIARDTGRPLITHTIDSALEAGLFDLVAVVTMDRPIVEAVTDHYADAFPASFGFVLPEGLPPKFEDPYRCGTDRIADAAQNIGLPDDAIVVNLQGDEPGLSPEALRTVVGLIRDGADMATLHRDAAVRAHESADTNVVKVLPFGGLAMEFTRRDVSDLATVWHPHLGVYAFRMPALQRFALRGRTEPERKNRLEQLRTFAMDPPLDIAIAGVDHRTPGINTPEDYRVFCSRQSS